MKKSKKRKLHDLNLSIHNYKGFKNETNFNLKRINLFVGANSTGKSSLRNFLSLLNDNKKFDYNLYEFNLLKSNSNLDYNSILNRDNKDSEITFKYYNSRFHWSKRESSFHGGHKTTKGAFNTFEGYFNDKIMFKYYFDNGFKLKINIRELISYIQFKKSDINHYFSPYEVEEIFDYDLELSKLKKLPDEILCTQNVRLSRVFEYGKYDDSYNSSGIDSYMKSLDFTDNEIISWSTNYLVCRIFNDYSSSINELMDDLYFISGDESIVESGDELLDEFPYPNVGYDNSVILENLGFETKIIAIRDENGVLYGRKQQVKINGCWFYLDELGSGLRKFINLITNFENSYRSFREQMYGGFYFLEEPENKLHPDLEIKLVEFLLKKELCHIVVETHSQNIIRAIQLAVAEKRIDADEVGIFDFSMSENEGIKIQQININEQGVLESNFKSGFADLSRQIDNKLFDIYHKINSVN